MLPHSSVGIKTPGGLESNTLLHITESLDVRLGLVNSWTWLLIAHVTTSSSPAQSLHTELSENMKQDASSATSIHIFHPQIHEQSRQAHSTFTEGEYLKFKKIFKSSLKNPIWELYDYAGSSVKSIH